MRAESAKKLTEEAIKLAELADLEQMAPLFEKIREAAASGKSSLTVDKLSNPIRKQLHKNGYIVRTDNEASEQDTIDWSNPVLA